FRARSRASQRGLEREAPRREAPGAQRPPATIPPHLTPSRGVTLMTDVSLGLRRGPPLVHEPLRAAARGALRSRRRSVEALVSEGADKRVATFSSPRSCSSPASPRCFYDPEACSGACSTAVSQSEACKA